MTLETFAEIIATRIPTAEEMIAFAKSQGWRFVVGDGKAAIMASRNDPMAVAFARMLSREPYRTRVLEQLKTPVPEVKSVPKPKPAHKKCRKCGRKTDEKRRCWQCQERICEGCGRSTGSVFIATCNACAQQIA